MRRMRVVCMPLFCMYNQGHRSMDTCASMSTFTRSHTCTSYDCIFASLLYIINTMHTCALALTQKLYTNMQTLAAMSWADARTGLILLFLATLSPLACGFGLCPGLPPFSSLPALRGNALGNAACGRFVPAMRVLPRSGKVASRPLAAASLRMSGEDVEKWTSGQVAAWLEREGFNAEWQKAFADNEIDGEALKLMKDPAVLDDMQIPKQVGARLKFWQKLDAIVPLERRGTTTVYAAAAAVSAAQVSAGSLSSSPTTFSSSTAQSATTPTFPSSTGTTTLIAPVDVDTAAKLAGESLSGPLNGATLDALMRDETQFVDRMCELLADLDAKDRDVALLLDLKDRLNSLFSVVIVGEFNAGKSSLINAILGSRFCQEGVVPTTTTINMLRYGEGAESGQVQRNKDYVEMFLPVPLLKQVTVVDTPGTNAIIKEQTKLTKGFIPQSDLVIFVTSAERPVTETEGKLLGYIREWGKKVVMVLNKVDLFEENEDPESQAKVLAFVRENSERILGSAPPVFGVAGRLALNSKLTRARGDEAGADVLWRRSQFAPLESYIVNQLTDKKEAAKLKLESPLGVAERFLDNYRQAASLGGKITQDDKIVLRELMEAITAYENAILDALQLKLDKVDAILGQLQQRAAASAARVLSGGYIASNLVGVLSKSMSVENDLRVALALDLDAELKALAQDFGRVIRDKQDSQWNLCSALITQRLSSRGWQQIKLVKPDLSVQLEGLVEAVSKDAKRSAGRFDPEVETLLLGKSVAGKAFDVAVATVSVAGGGLLALEVFNAGLLDALAFLGTGGGLAYSLGVYPSMMQDEVTADLETRAKVWKEDLREEVRELFKEAAVKANFEMEQAFGPYVDAVSVEASKWETVNQRVTDLSGELKSIRSRINAL